MICITLNDCFLDVSFYFCLNLHEVDDSFTFIWKKILCHIFLFLFHILSFGSSDPNCKLTHRKYGFLITSKMSFMSSGDKQIFVLKISVPNFADFDMKITLTKIVSSGFPSIELTVVYFKTISKL